MMSLPCLFRPPLKSPSFQGSRSSLSAILLTGILCSPLICPAAESDPAPAAESQPAANAEPATAVDHVRQLQTEATLKGHSPIAHWGTDPAKYQQWGSHSNRLIPVYTFGTKGGGDGLDLNSLTGPHSTYRSEEKLRQLYGHVPVDTVSDKAEYLDQTDIYGLQKAALAAGRKYIFLVVFDGMDWQTTQAAAIVRRQQVPYTEGRGQGLHFQDYAANGTSQFGWMVTSPHNQGTKVDVNTQTISNPG
ncbi:MAG: hypothetical protein KDA79_14745, partial [Planctomycetaceae bacterium]|nr:hypothetical protein [Planctomycetaceae bacterium]